MLDIEKIRADFPILHRDIHEKPLVYLDNAATTQKPIQVLDQIMEYYRCYNSNIHRGVHTLSEKASELIESARETVRLFINAEHCEEIVFTRGTTESINLLADVFGWGCINRGDEIIVTQMEHHSNLVPWQILCEKHGAVLKAIPVDQDGQLLKESLGRLIKNNTGLIALTYVSNALGTVNPIKEIISLAHQCNVPVLVDAAQAIQHLPLDVQEMDCDFCVFSGHKMYAETGIGVLYGKKKWLEKMPPYQSGGGMVDNVDINKTTFAQPPLKFEAGTVNISGAISLAAAIEYIQNISYENIYAHEQSLVNKATEAISEIEGVRIYGPSTRCGIVSFNLDNAHCYDVGMILDKLGIAVRTGHHCAQPLMDLLGVDGTVRASFGVYNSFQDIKCLADGIKKAKAMLC